MEIVYLIGLLFSLIESIGTLLLAAILVLIVYGIFKLGMKIANAGQE